MLRPPCLRQYKHSSLGGMPRWLACLVVVSPRSCNSFDLAIPARTTMVITVMLLKSWYRIFASYGRICELDWFVSSQCNMRCLGLCGKLTTRSIALVTWPKKQGFERTTNEGECSNAYMFHRDFYIIAVNFAFCTDFIALRYFTLQIIQTNFVLCNELLIAARLRSNLALDCQACWRPAWAWHARYVKLDYFYEAKMCTLAIVIFR